MAPKTSNPSSREMTLTTTILAIRYSDASVGGYGIYARLPTRYLSRSGT